MRGDGYIRDFGEDRDGCIRRVHEKEDIGSSRGLVEKVEGI
jgi:hypothetical protein